MPSDREFINTHVMRSRLMLEVASDLVARPDWHDRQVQIHLREQGGESWKFCLFASDAPASVHGVARGEADIAIVNPGGVLAMATLGAGPFKEPIPDLRVIMVFPQFDQLAFGVTPQTGLRSLTDLRDRRYPLRVSLRGQRDHSVHLLTNVVFSVMGFSRGLATFSP